ncbi:MAG: DUF5063 domain-containing protein, partial [Bacteroidaceae bacterium]|nr:DUF5063 domain-containing protein [Bacteroidaceae bacterium]
EFVTVGVEYCSLIERASQMERREFNLNLVRILPLLYLKATLLPTEEIDEADDLEFYVTEEQYEYLRGAVAKLLGEADDYLEVFEADMAYSDTPLAASISEGLADIYQDVRDLLEIYRLGNEELSQAAICRCRRNFIAYWGQKLVNVMRPLHTICFSPDAEDDDEHDGHSHDEHHHCDDDNCHCHHHDDIY